MTKPNALKTWIDENTGREVRQLTDFPGGCSLDYFRFRKHLPDGRMLAHAEHAAGNLVLVEPDSGDVQPVPLFSRGYLGMCQAGGRYWCLGPDRQILQTNLPEGHPQVIGRLPDDVRASPNTITCDCRTLILSFSDARVAEMDLPRTKDAAAFWRYIRRPRTGALYAYDLETGSLCTLLETVGMAPFHADASPKDPTLVRYSLDHWEGYNQRVFATRVDGSTKPWPIRPQASGELVTHEFWWADGEHIGYAFQDRRLDPSCETLPWCEYGLASTQLGIADSAGRQVYLSDPLNHYHTHLYCSLDGTLVSGSGTDGHSFVHAAAFDWKSTRVDLVPLATIHTPYVPFRGQGVNCDFSGDGKWLLFSDTVAGQRQLCAVAVDL